jgi:hypothetical protein
MIFFSFFTVVSVYKISQVAFDVYNDFFRFLAHFLSHSLRALRPYLDFHDLCVSIFLFH